MGIPQPAPKRAAPAARAFRDDIDGKLLGANETHAAAVAALTRLQTQSELPDGTGIVVTSEDLASARKHRDTCSEECERLRAVRVEAERRLADAEREDAALDLGDDEREAEDLRVRLEKRLSLILTEARSLAEQAAAYQRDKAELVAVSPWYAARVSLKVAAFLDEGLHRLLRLTQLAGGAFHPNFMPKPHNTFADEIKRLVDDERRALRALGDMVPPETPRRKK